MLYEFIIRLDFIVAAVEGKHHLNMERQAPCPSILLPGLVAGKCSVLSFPLTPSKGTLYPGLTVSTRLNIKWAKCWLLCMWEHLTS